eukprot:2812835-Amphidinium_carterae.1
MICWERNVFTLLSPPQLATYESDVLAFVVSCVRRLSERGVALAVENAASSALWSNPVFEACFSLGFVFKFVPAAFGSGRMSAVRVLTNVSTMTTMSTTELVEEKTRCLQVRGA